MSRTSDDQESLLTQQTASDAITSPVASRSSLHNGVVRENPEAYFRRAESAFAMEMARRASIELPDSDHPQRISIVAPQNADLQQQTENERPSDYKGRIRTCPGGVLLLLVIVASIGAVTYFGIQIHNATKDKVKTIQIVANERRKIKDTVEDREVLEKAGILEVIEEVVDEDGEIGNPKEYPPPVCAQPNYLSRDGQIFLQTPNGTEFPIKFKGVNWFGMETEHATPFGLWENFDNGTTVYEIAAFLARNKFNAVRFPVAVTNILENKAPNQYFINQQSNRGISLKDYMSMLKGIVSAFGFRKIGVVISIHYLTPQDKGALWYSSAVPEEKTIEAIEMLAEELCDQASWNVIGIDLKNEPYEATWGGDIATDWRRGATRLGNAMLQKCPKWLAFIEGTAGPHTIELEGDQTTYYDWWGAGLQKAATEPIELSIPNKIVWAPHFYTPSVYPATYFFASGRRGNAGIYEGYVELATSDLDRRVRFFSDAMFGHLTHERKGAIVLGEFGGIYATDQHPLRTGQRVCQICMDYMKGDGYAGGFMWSLNPESKYEYNPADKYGKFQEGLLTLDWLGVNHGYVKALRTLDNMANLHKLTCHLVDPVVEESADD